ncbi:T9SS type A sorting domain-containing protein [Lacinutrix sp. MEBiC02595]
MKKNYVLILLFITLTPNIHAQNYWGVDASVDVANAEFQNDFIETGTAGNYSNSTWTALSINDNGGTVTPGAAYWTRNTLGYSQGAYWSAPTPTNAPSQANGIAIFDSDFMDNGGTPNAFGTGTSPSTHKGELISPRINLTGNTDVPLAVKFYSQYRNFAISELSVSFSSDDGTTWGTSVAYTTLQATPFDEGFLTLALPATSTQGVSNLSQCRLKFTFDGDYYFAIIDDVTILNAAALSTDNFTQNHKVTLFPNPATDYIQINGLTKTEDYTIYNTLGQEVKSGFISENQKLDIQSLANGMYFLKLEEGNSFKFMKK